MGNSAEEGGREGWMPRAPAAPFAPKEGTALAEAVILMRDHPQWAIWLPVRGGDWTAIRPATSRPPAPELPTIWIHAGSASELARLMQAGDEQLSGRDVPDPNSRQGPAH
jgi:hypothetical protein